MSSSCWPTQGHCPDDRLMLSLLLRVRTDANYAYTAGICQAAMCSQGHFRVVGKKTFLFFPGHWSESWHRPLPTWWLLWLHLGYLMKSQDSKDFYLLVFESSWHLLYPLAQELWMTKELFHFCTSGYNETAQWLLEPNRHFFTVRGRRVRCSQSHPLQ